MIDKMPYGKYAGVPLKELDSTYIVFKLLETENISLELFEALKYELNTRIELVEWRLKERFGS